MIFLIEHSPLERPLSSSLMNTVLLVVEGAMAWVIIAI